MKADGRIGPMTIAALREFMRRRGAEGQVVLLRALNALQGAFYVEPRGEAPPRGVRAPVQVGAVQP